MLRRSLILIAMIWPPALAAQNPTGVIPVLVATKSNGPSTTAKTLANKMFADKDLPPITLDLQLDFDVSFTPPTPREKTPKPPKKVVPKKVKPQPPPKKVVPKAIPKKVVPKPLPKKVVPKPLPPPKKVVPKVVPKTVILPPPPPPQQRLVEVKPVVLPPPPLAPKPIVPRKTFSSRMSDIQQRLSAANKRVSEHKYATVVWATLLFVWAPLLLIWAVNKFMGKEFLIEIIVRLFPLAPATWIEMAIEDGLWVGIFGVCVVATVGTSLIEVSTLIMDFFRGLAQAQKDKQEQKLAM